MATKKRKTKRKPTKRTTGTRRSGDEAASKAGKLLAQYRELGVSGLEKDWYVKASDRVTWGDVAAVSACVLNQDEVPGLRASGRRR
jgi:hypothetical protein